MTWKGLGYVMERYSHVEEPAIAGESRAIGAGGLMTGNEKLGFCCQCVNTL
jgi:hypothetical protein